MAKEEEKTLLCPLTHLGCDKKACAWWSIKALYGDRYIYDCAIKVLAERPFND